MAHWQERTSLLLGEAALRRLSNAHVLVVGLGGVGGMAAEMLARAGVGRLTLVDMDEVHETNLNRQVLATRSSLGLAKGEAARNRLLDINPDVELRVLAEFLRDERLIEVVASGFDGIVDAIDTLSPKVYLIKTASELGVPFVTALGAGGKTDPNQVRVGSFWRVENCHLGRVLRKRLRKLGVNGSITAVYSTERAREGAVVHCEEEQNKKSRVGVISYMPNLFGCMVAGEIIRQILSTGENLP